MGSEITTFGECAQLITDSIQPDMVDPETPYIGLQHIAQDELRLIDVGKASDVSSNKYYFKKGDILFGKLRPYFRKVIIASFDGVCSTDIWVVRATEKCDQTYLFYWMASQDFVDKANQGSEGTKMPRAKWDFVSKINKDLPKRDEQVKIGNLLRAFDDKIELNQSMNETLEGISRAIFQSWFVDFDPVRAKMAGKPYPLPDEVVALFPDELVESKLGLIPEGWEVGTIGDITKTMIGGDWGEDKGGNGYIKVRCLRGTDLEILRKFGYSNDIPIRWIKKESLKKRSISELDIIIAASGVGPLGRPLWMSSDIKNHYAEPISYSNFTKRLRAKSIEYAIYLDLILFDMRETNKIWEYATGTSIPNLDIEGLLTNHKILLPEKEIITEFARLITPAYNKLYSCENQILSSLREVNLQIINTDMAI